MKRYELQNYGDFVAALLDAGFTVGGGNSEGVFALVPWSWNEAPPYETPVCWHTGDPETDPWEWRMRVLDERGDIAYAKLFFRKSGFITRDWYPHFLAVRRGGDGAVRSFDEVYRAGRISHEAKRVYRALEEHGTLPLHALRPLAGFGGKADKSRFDRALVELQMRMFITMCGRRQKLSQMGLEYGWFSTVFCLAEQFFGEEVFERAARMDSVEAAQAIGAQIERLNPEADPKKARRFICG